MFVAQTGAQRALAMLGAKLRGEPFVTEVPLVEYDVVGPLFPKEKLLPDACNADVI